MIIVTYSKKKNRTWNSKMHPAFIQSAIFNSKSLSNDSFFGKDQKSLSSDVDNVVFSEKQFQHLKKFELSCRIDYDIARCKIGFCSGRRKSINVIYINPKWRGGNTDVRFTTSLRWFTCGFIAQCINKIFIHFSCMSQQSYLYCRGFVDEHVNASRWKLEIAQTCIPK